MFLCRRFAPINFKHWGKWGGGGEGWGENDQNFSKGLWGCSGVVVSTLDLTVNGSRSGFFHRVCFLTQESYPTLSPLT